MSGLPAELLKPCMSACERQPPGTKSQLEKTDPFVPRVDSRALFNTPINPALIARVGSFP